MASLSTMLSRPVPTQAAMCQPRSRTSRLVVAADGSRQEQKAAYVKKQDEAQAKNPALEKNVSNVRAKEHSSGAYGATDKQEDREQIQGSDHTKDALHPVKKALGLEKDEDEEK